MDERASKMTSGKQSDSGGPITTEAQAVKEMIRALKPTLDS